ncbi:hypothetical protein [Streptomyces sp. RKAG337]|uniref:hypothetical protein n=1 Tax=Streptomyces sp. RKAG337 TaxID=2893404 RepID=UPI0020338101|nr:hypothetical protein [Streptomyces sp. RKAG337]MCM2424913.1 hypothetical protein [Streptomyces sp. RKAG337]
MTTIAVMGMAYWMAMGLAMILAMALVGFLALIVVLFAAVIAWKRKLREARLSGDDAWYTDLIAAPSLALVAAFITVWKANPNWQWINDHQTIASSDNPSVLFWLMPLAFILFVFALYGTFVALATPRSSTGAWIRFSSYSGFLFYAVYFSIGAVLAAHNMENPVQP